MLAGSHAQVGVRLIRVVKINFNALQFNAVLFLSKK